MVQDIVHVDLDALGVGSLDQLLKVLLSAIQLAYGIVVVHVIGMIAVGGMCRRQPQCGGSEPVQIVQLGNDALEVAYPISIAVREGIDQQLVSGRSPLVSVESVRHRDQGHYVGPDLRHRDGSILGSSEGYRPFAVVGPFVGVYRHGDGAAGGTGSLVQMDPARGWRSVP